MKLRTIPSWKRTPFLRIVIPFSVGILVQYYFPLPLLHTWFALVCSLIVVVSFLLSPYHVFRFKFITGLAINVLILSSGALCVKWKDPLSNKEHLAYVTHTGFKTGGLSSTPIKQGNSVHADTFAEGIEGYIATIDSELCERAASFRCYANVQFIIKEKRKYRSTGTIIFYFPKVDSLLLPSIGDVLYIRKLPSGIPSSLNPGGFSFKDYCALKGIYFQQFLNNTDYTILLKGKPHWFDSFLIALRNYVLSIIRKNIHGRKEAGLAEALLIGYKEDLDDGLLDSYSNTGVVHVIAISGLHLALIYWILDRLSKILSRNIAARAVLVIIGLWLFTLLAGASPSVVRSAVMFSVIVIGEAFNKRSDILNGLAASAFLLLCFNPYWLWDLGFQLSYAAVLSLVLFAKPVYDLFYIRNKGLDQLWKMVSVTIAAQVCTIPVILFNFHQFPVYFIVTNIICVPLSSAILIMELLLCIISFIPIIASITGTLIFYGIKWMNDSVEFFERMPFASIDQIKINPWQVFLLFVAISFLYQFLKEHHSKKFLAFLIVIAIHCSISLVSKQVAVSQSFLVIYNIPRSTAIDLVRGRNAWMIADSNGFTNKKIWKHQVEPSRIYFRVESNNGIKGNLYPVSNRVFEFMGQTVLLLNNNVFTKKEKTNKKPKGSHESSRRKKVDLVIISSSPSLSLFNLTERISPGMIVIDGSNSRKKISSWKAECAQLSIPCHVTTEQGAFVMNLNSTNFAASHKDFDQ